KIARHTVGERNNRKHRQHRIPSMVPFCKDSYTDTGRRLSRQRCTYTIAYLP
ncbi:unnamed protein product, partial [Candidula unifasciata]